MKISSKNILLVAALFTFTCAGFSYCSEMLGSNRFQIAKAMKKQSVEKKSKSKENDIEKEDEDSLFLKEAEKNNDYLPDIYRCPECGYEQDEEGSCPDHNKTPLLKILSKGKNPLMPVEFNGNEDLIVDIPLKSLQFKKMTLEGLSTTTKDLNKDINPVKRGGSK